MIVFVLVFLWIPSVLGDCSEDNLFGCQEGTCTDSCLVWQNPVYLCKYSEEWSDYKTTIEECLGGGILKIPSYADENWNFQYDTVFQTCRIVDESSVLSSVICKCNEPCGNQPKTKSKLSTEAIIGITLGTLLIISITLFIFRNQLRFAKQTGEQLLQ